LIFSKASRFIGSFISECTGVTTVIAILQLITVDGQPSNQVALLIQ